MKLAYTIDQSIALDSKAGYFDLHNCYNVVNVQRTGTRCSVGFAKVSGEWVKPEEPAHLTLVFEQVTSLQLSADLCFPAGLEFIGFKEPQEQDMTCFREQPDSELVHLVLGLDDDAFIRIGAVSSFCLTGPLA